MTKRVLLLSVGVLLVLSLWLREQSQSDAPLVPLVAAATQSTPTANAGPDQSALLTPSSRSPRSTEIRRALDYRSALQTLNARSLDWDVARVTAHQDVRIACTLVHRPDRASPRVDMDTNRQPWLDQLQRRCSGLAAAMLEPLPFDDPALRAWSALVPESVAARFGRSAALRHSDDLLRHSVDVRLLYQALRFRLVEGALPLEQIFVGSQPPVSADIELALVNAADWIGCQRSDSCGSDGLWTLYTCAQFGCPAGTDLPSALQRISPQWQYEISRSVANWVLSRSERPLQ